MHMDCSNLQIVEIKDRYIQNDIQQIYIYVNRKILIEFTCVELASARPNYIINVLQIWSLQGGVCELTLHGHEGAVSCLQFDETRIISGALDRLIKIWNITNGEVYHRGAH